MKTIVITVFISSLTMISLSYIFKESISERIRNATCTDIDLYHMKIKLCDDQSKNNLVSEMESINSDFKKLKNRYKELKIVNNKIQNKLDNCSNDSQVLKLKEESMELEKAYKILLPELEVYKLENHLQQ